MAGTKTKIAPTWIEELVATRATVTRRSTAETVADILRQHITEGRIQPGEQMAEEPMAQALNVSRNTLREAFRLLSRERLLVHRINRGVFVRTLSEVDIADLYRSRRLAESHALSTMQNETPSLLLHVRDTVNDGLRASASDDWRAMGTADIAFHKAVVDLAASPRLSEVAAQWLSELRLAFHLVDEPLSWHRDYLQRNQSILSALEEGHQTSAQQQLGDYLNDAERQILRAHRAKQRATGTR